MARQRTRDRHTDAALTREEISHFMAGVWTYMKSEWLQWARYDERAGTLEVRFKDGHPHSEPADVGRALNFALAPSKGGWWHDKVMGR